MKNCPYYTGLFILSTFILYFCGPSVDKKQSKKQSLQDKPKTSARKPAILGTPQLIEYSLNKPKERLYIGRLVSNHAFNDRVPDRYCLEDGGLWLGAPLRIGRLNLFPNTPVPDSLIGRFVAVIGVKKESLQKKIRRIDTCAQSATTLQYRSDWLSEEGGTFTNHDTLKRIGYIEATAISEIELLSAPPPIQRPRKVKSISSGHLKEPDKKLSITIHNSLPDPLNSIFLVIHYEGGARKVMPAYRSMKVALKPGESKSVHIPARIVQAGLRDNEVFLYNTAYMIGKQEAIEFLGPSNFRVKPSDILVFDSHK